MITTTKTLLHTARDTVREVTTRADRLHPVALLALIALVIVLGWGAATVVGAALVALVHALVILVQAGAVVGAAVLVLRLAYRSASSGRRPVTAP
ncbi:MULTISPECIES: hypothetical protein [unclassified Streptomyces]|uniref:hypothetical protein n=1 Tax=unclassified Streptomyces TaxID=2593676 RepID=UPI0013A6D18D|nr:MULTISPECIES: hypothetical protein [unclassified Streptomyces]